MKIAILINGLFPNGLAETDKLIKIAKIFSEGNISTTILIRYGNNIDNQNSIIESQGYLQGIKYRFLSGSAYRNSKFIIRNALKFWGTVVELFSISKYDFILTNTRSYFTLLFYKIFSLLFNTKIFLTYVEHDSSLANRSFKKKINDYLFENYAFSMVYRVFPISSTLENIVRKKNPKIKTYVLPALVDFELFQSINATKVGDFLLFCGSAAYLSIIDFIIESFEKLKRDNVKLLLIVSGSKQQKNEIFSRISISSKKQMIIVLSDLNYFELVDYYKSAKALLIPLQENYRDKARFPHKIGEYSASGIPIITNNWGDVNLYFENRKNAYICNSYSSDEYAKTMEEIILDPEQAESVGKEAIEVCIQKFYYKSYISKISYWVS